MVKINELFFNGDPAGRKKHMNEFFVAHKANGLDWATTEVEMIKKLEEVRSITMSMIGKRDLRIAELENELAAKEATIIDLESHIEALKIAWKHRKEDI